MMLEGGRGVKVGRTMFVHGVARWCSITIFRHHMLLVSDRGTEFRSESAPLHVPLSTARCCRIQ